jgi:ubiquinone/menaquinone biosynthesis C-methylase UbiE
MSTCPRTTAVPEAVEIKTIMRDERWNARHAKAYNRYRLLSSKGGWARLLARELAGLPAGTEVLEVGSGTGFISEILAGSGFNVWGMDLSPDMLAVASSNLEAAGLAGRARFTVGDAEALDAPDGQARTVVSRWVLWTLPRPRLALQEMVRVLAPGGKLVLIDGQHLPMGRLARIRAALVDMVVAGRLPGWRRPCYTRLTPGLPRLDAPAVVDILREAGLADVSYRRLTAEESDGAVKSWLMGSGWQSYLVTGIKPQ